VAHPQGRRPLGHHAGLTSRGVPHRAGSTPPARPPVPGTATTLWLVRHGQAGPFGVLLGHSDPPLSDLGRRQAEAAAAALADLPVTALYASDLARARGTAEAASRALGRQVTGLRALRERDFGAWEGRAVADLARDAPDDLAALWGDGAFAPPGGESLDALAARVLPAVRRIVAGHPGADVAVVGHAGAHRAVLGHALGLGAAGLLRLGLDPGHACVVRWFPDGNLHVAAVNLPPVAWARSGPARREARDTAPAGADGDTLAMSRTRNERLART